MRTLLIILAALLCGYQGMTQVSRLSVDIPKGVYTVKGDYYFDYHNYNTAITNYRKSVNQNPKDAYAMLRIADAHHKLGNDELASSWYDKALRLNADIEETYILKYMSILNKYGKYDEVRRWMTVYTDKVNKKYAPGGTNESYKDSTWFLLTNIKSLNSAKSDAGAALYNDKLIFSSDRSVNTGDKYTLYQSVVDANDQYSALTPLTKTINSGTNEGDVAIAHRKGRLFFSKTGQSKGDKKALPEVFFCDLSADQSDPVKSDKLVIKNFDHGMEHPAVNSDGTVLYFTSNNPKHGHGFDLYRSEFVGKKWSAPHPLHTGINTKGDELYPVLYNDSILYFASNRPGGLGGLDIYRVNTRHKHPHVEHLNAPVNSPADDFGLVFNNKGTEGYLTSNRTGGLGGNDLYKVYALPVKVKKSAENALKPEVLSIYTSAGDEIKLSGKSKENLEFDFVPGIAYSLIMEHDNYKTGTINNGSKTELPKRNTYTFHIQKSGEVIAQQGNRNAKVHDTHINPGDLITFQLIPSKVLDYESDDSRIRLNKAEEKISGKATIVFSYVAEGGPEIPGINDTTTIADSNDAGKNNLPPDEDAAPDTVSSTGTALAKKAQPDNKILNPVTDKTAIANQKNSVSSPETITTADAKISNSPSTALNDTDKKNDNAKADTVSSTGTVLAKNTQPDNKIPNPVTGKTEITNQKNTVSTPEAIKTAGTKNSNSPSTGLSDSGKSNLQKSDNVMADTVSSTGTVLVKNTQGDNRNLNPVTGKTEIANQKNTISTTDAIKTADAKNSNSPSTVLNDTDKSSLPATDNPKADTVSSTGTVLLAKNTQPDNKILNPVTRKTEIANQKNTISTTDAIETADTKNSNSSSVLSDTGKSNLQKNDNAIADTVSSTETVLAKNTRADNKILNPVTGKTEISNQKNVVSSPDALKTTDAKISNSPSVVLNDTGKNNLQKNDNAIADAVSSTGTVLAKNTQADNKILNPVTGKSEGVEQNNVTFSTDVNKSNNNTRKLITVAGDSLNRTGEMAKKEIISNGTQEKGLANTTKQPATTSITKPLTLSDSIERNAAIVKNNQTKNSTQLSLANEATKPEETKQQKQPDSKDKIAGANAVSKNAAEVAQQNLKNIDRMADVGQRNSSDKNTAVTKNESIKDSSVSSTGSLTFTNREANDFQYRVQIAASPSEVKDALLKKIYRGTKEIRFFKEDGYYKYYIEETPSYPDARKVLKESGVDNAFIAAYKGDTKWKLNEAIAFQKKQRMQLVQSGNENTIAPQTANNNVGTLVQPDAQNNTAPVSGDITTNKEVQGETVAKYSSASSQAIVMKENSSGNKEKKNQSGTINQVDNSTPILNQPSDSLEAGKVAGLTSSIPRDKKQTEQNQSTNKTRNSDPNPVAENEIRTTQQAKLADVAPTRDSYHTTGLTDRNNVSAKNVHPIDTSQYQFTNTPDYGKDATGGNNDFQYRIQIAASRAELKKAQLKKIYNGDREIRSFKEDGYYKYYIGEAPRYYVASQILKESRADNAFISVYKGNTKWQLQEAIAFQNKVPEIRSELAKTDSLVRIVTVNFELDEFILPPNERSHLQEYVIGQLKANEGYHTIVNGYADIRGSEEYNFGLSQERAFFVEQLIVDGGIPSERVTTQYFGESQVIKYCPENERCDESVHQVNRRVEILLLMNRK